MSISFYSNATAPCVKGKVKGEVVSSRPANASVITNNLMSIFLGIGNMLMHSCNKLFCFATFGFNS